MNIAAKYRNDTDDGDYPNNAVFNRDVTFDSDARTLDVTKADPTFATGRQFKPNAGRPVTSSTVILILPKVGPVTSAGIPMRPPET